MAVSGSSRRGVGHVQEAIERARGHHLQPTNGTTLTLTWPRQGGPPKVNTVRLSDDGTTYQGKNDRDWVVKGVKIPDQPR